MLRQVADGVFIHQSEFLQTNTIVVRGQGGVLLIDPGVTINELACLTEDLRELRQPVVAGFSTHPHWDHLLWHSEFGTAPRYATSRCAAAVDAWLSAPGAKAAITSSGLVPPELDDRVPLDLLGEITAMPEKATRLPWDGPDAWIVEHQAHAPGHAALLIKQRGVLVAGDMLSDVLIPMPDFNATDPLGDYLVALAELEHAAGGVDLLIPGHGSIGGADQIPERIARDRSYVLALGEGANTCDPRLGAAAYGRDWLPGVHERQLQQLSRR